jgi:hypothetical protein
VGPEINLLSLLRIGFLLVSPDIVVYICKTSTQETEAGGAEFEASPGYISETLSQINK